MPSVQQAIDAIEASRDVHKEAWAKLTDVIAEKALLAEDYDDERLLRATASRRVTHYGGVLANLRAANTVVSAPTREEIRTVARLIKEVRDMTIASAITSAGITFITNSLTTSVKAAKKVQV
tara:strand:- start:30 stop:395 length:366 start_codon:yes stop_codon:yes gene_type:complete